MSERIGTAILGLALVTLSGCSTKDPAKCTSGLATARQALTVKDIALATQWREYAYKQCEDLGQLGQLDKEIVERQAAIAKEQSDKLKVQAEQKQLLALFRDWVAAARTAPEKSVNTPACEGEDDAKLKASKERFCSGSRAVTGIASAALRVRYWEKSPADVALFTVRLPLPVSCNDFGGHRAIKVTQIPASSGRTVARTHCEFTDGPLSGLQALATEANSNELKVFSVKYPEQDPTLRMQLQ